MANEQIVKWIEDNQAAGYNLAQLRDALIGNGYDSKDVDEAVSFISSKTASVLMPAAEKNVDEARERKKKVLIGGGIFAGLLIFGIFMLLLFSGKQETIPAPIIEQAPIVNVDTSIPDNYSFTMNTRQSLINVNGNKNDYNSLESASESNGLVDLKTNASYKHVKTRFINPDQSGFSDIESERYIVGETVYSRIISVTDENGGNPQGEDAEVIGMWTKETIQDLQKTPSINFIIDLLEGSLDLKNQIRLIDSSKTENVGSDKNHFKIILEQKTLSSWMDAMFIEPDEKLSEFIGTGDLTAEEIARIEREFTLQNLVSNTKNINIEYWTDERSRLTRIDINVSVDKFTTDGSLAEGDHFMSTQISGYNTQSAIVVPADALTASAPKALIN